MQSSVRARKIEKLPFCASEEDQEAALIWLRNEMK
jgi:hypothetical protein